MCVFKICFVNSRRNKIIMMAKEVWGGKNVKKKKRYCRVYTKTSNAG